MPKILVVFCWLRWFTWSRDICLETSLGEQNGDDVLLIEGIYKLFHNTEFLSAEIYYPDCVRFVTNLSFVSHLYH